MEFCAATPLVRMCASADLKLAAALNRPAFPAGSAKVDRRRNFFYSLFMISVESVTKCYGALEAVADLSFKVDSGEIVGFVGPNGAGKSTVLKMLSTYTRSTRGRITVDGLDVVENPLAVRRKDRLSGRRHPALPGYAGGQVSSLYRQGPRYARPRAATRI